MIYVRSGKNPFELLLLGACVVSGLAGIVAPASTSPATAALLNSWELYAWYGGLLAGSVVALGGVLHRHLTHNSVALERIGLSVLGCLVWTYVVVIVSAGGSALGPSGASSMAFGLACIARCVQITRDLSAAARRAADRRE